MNIARYNKIPEHQDYKAKMINKEKLDVSKLIGKRVISASSSLKNFSIELDGGVGLRLDAAPGPLLAVEIVASADLPKQTEAVCSVDWSWIYQATIKNLTVSSNVLKLELDPVGPITISAGTWQGSPFLSFQPYKAPAR